MPKSRVRRKAPFTPPPKGQSAASKMSGRWVAPLMVGFFVVGLAWIVVYYIASSVMPIQGNINLIIGFGLLGAGFITATRWK
ncbi:MAG TPA: cell division protein CrgA [Actinomycetes bacterium]